MSVSEPGTATIFTQVVLLCLLNADTMCCSLSVSGGVCDVQKRACLVPELHPARGGPELCPPEEHAAPTTRKAISEAVRPRPGSNDMAAHLRHCTPRLLPVGPATGPTGARARRRGAAITPPNNIAVSSRDVNCALRRELNGARFAAPRDP